MLERSPFKDNLEYYIGLVPVLHTLRTRWCAAVSWGRYFYLITGLVVFDGFLKKCSLVFFLLPLFPS